MKTRPAQVLTESELRMRRERAWESFMSAAWAHSVATGQRVRAVGIRLTGDRWAYVFVCESRCARCQAAFAEAIK